MIRLIGILLVAVAVTVGLLFEIPAASEEVQKLLLDSTADVLTSDGFSLKKKLRGLTLDEKIGQMLMVSIPGASLSPEVEAWLGSRHIGGIILLGKNVGTSEEVRNLIAALRRIQSAGVAPFIAVDQEGGIVSRFREPLAEELTAQSDITTPELAEAVARIRGAQLRELGVNVNFSPVLDISTDPKEFMYSRSFRGDVNVVAALGAAMVRGYQEGNMIPVAKHFPGHGATAVDPHKNLPVAFRDPATLARHLAPFEHAIANGVPMVMIGHLKIPELDSVYPTSMSAAVTSDLLRTRLGYRGVVITDDLGMGAITKSYALPDAAVLAVHAGADIVLAVRSQGDYDAILRALKESVEDGAIVETKIDESVLRILRLKRAMTTLR